MNTSKQNLAAPQAGFAAGVKTVLGNNLVMVAILAMVAVTAILEPKFLSGQNIRNIMSQLGALSIVSLGMTFVITCGFVDLSVAGIINLVAVVTLSLIDPLGQVGALLAGLALGAGLGLLNSVLIISAGATTMADALFITFGMSSVYGALALMVTGGGTLQMRWVNADTSLFTAMGSGLVGPLSVAVLIFIICLFVLHVFLSRTATGRAISYTGGNKTAAGLAGIPVKKCIMLVFAICGLMTALGAVVLFSRVTQASPVMGVGFETNAILAVVVGGTSLKGGNGSVLRTVLGIVLVTLMSNCMNLLGVSSYLQIMFSGLILMVAIWLDNRRGQKGVGA